MRSPSGALGVILVVIGAVALVASIGHDTGLADSLRWLWPLAIVGAGVWLLVAASGARRWGARGWDESPASRGASNPWPGAPTGTSATADASGSPAGGMPPTAAPASAAPAGTSAPADWTAAGPTAPPAPAAPPAPTAPGAPAPNAIPPAGRAFTAASAAGRAQSGPWSQHERFFGEIELAGPIVLTPSTYETVFGEIRLDLSAAILPEGETYLRVGTVFGEVRILLPADAAVTVRGSSLLGETEILGVNGGSVMGEAVATTDNWTSATRRLRIDARTLLGGVAVRRARPPAWPSTPGPYGGPGAGTPAG